MTTDEIVAANLDKMNSFEQGGMRYLLDRESIGGTAGHREFEGKRFGCTGANFYFDNKTGEIKRFTNDAYEGDNWGDDMIGSAIFRIAVDAYTPAKNYNPFFRIIEVAYTYKTDSNQIEPSKAAVDVIAQCMARYNEASMAGYRRVHRA